MVKNTEMWNRIKKLNIKLHSKSVPDEKYMKAKVKIFNKVANTVFPEDKIPK